MAKVILSDVKKIYPGDVEAVKGFSMEIEDKEFIVLVGPSGCGKTTTLRMIAGLEEISEGELYIDDKMVNDIQPKDRDIAMVFQNYALYPHMTVYDNMAFGLKLRKVPKKEIDTKVRAAALILEMENLLDRKPKEMSGGQRQRVALGRAIVRNPKVFLMDEPLSNLDAKLRVQMRIEICKLHQKLETTFIYVTHDQTEAMTMGTRIVIMKDGVIQQIDSPQNVYKHPANLFVAQFIGSPQMNIFLGKVINEGDRLGIQLIDGKIFRLSKERSSFLKEQEYVNKNIYMGIRPEFFESYDETNMNPEYSTLDWKIEVAELMGAETYLYSQICGTQSVARVKADKDYRVGDTIQLMVDSNMIHFFDIDTEETIAVSNSSF